MIIEQPVFAACLTKNVKTPVLLVLFFWMFGCLAFNTIYKSSLSSQIIHPPVEKYRNVFELAEQGYNIGMEQEKTPFLGLIFGRRNYRNMKEKFFNISILCSAIPRVFNEKTAIAGEQSFLQHHCQTNYKQNYGFEVNYTPEPLSIVTHGWLFRKGAPFVESFNENIMRIQASGLMEKWLRDILWKRKQFFRSNEKNIERVKLTEFTSHFTLYTIGISISILAFLYEHIKYNIKKRNKCKSSKI
ncbi:uncharacterized protein LOC123688677 [Harmonia axyridis]|uniref:uncharacterized protein LOC123688677 n=1 Tax=Harmonia axyridis TaxID=115357 RepID=UPI001E2768D3|nr:uncharacterized protein LOC123688677 [Harmonia axyridis]